MNELAPATLVWSRCDAGDVDALLAIEQQVYSHPWTRGNFLDSLSAAHWAWKGDMADAGVRVYWLALPVLDELHLLNLAVHPESWGQGLARAAIAHLLEQARSQGLKDIWLEVRESNQRAQRLYRQQGFAMVGRRRGYYPAAAGEREDALLMRLSLQPLEARS